MNGGFWYLDSFGSDSEKGSGATRMNPRVGSLILVVGGAGYVGSVLVRELLDRGYAVRVYDRLLFGDAGLAAVRERVELVTGDLREVPISVFDDVAAVIHVGGLSNDPTAEYNPRANHQINTVATETLARTAKQRGIRRFLFASSASIYDLGLEDEAHSSLRDESSPVRPRAAYSTSKYEAERALLALSNSEFCVTILRKGTVFGFSPRMRYDLVVNTFVKDALAKSQLTVHAGGEMWRPLVEVRDVARAYLQCLAVEEDRVRGQIYNVVLGNFRISELALHVEQALEQIGVRVTIHSDNDYTGVRSYRVSGEKIHQQLGFEPTITVEESVKDMVQRIRTASFTDFHNPRYYNICWMLLLEEASRILNQTGYLFEKPQEGRAVRILGEHG